MTNEVRETDNQKERLLQTAAQLYALGIALEKARRELSALVQAGEPYTSERMHKALKQAQEIQAQWELTEQRYLSMRGKLSSKSGENVLFREKTENNS